MLRVVPKESVQVEEPAAPPPTFVPVEEPEPVTVLPSVRPGPAAPEPEPELPNAAVSDLPELRFGTLAEKVEVADDFDAPLAFAPTEPPPAADEEPVLVVKQTRTCGVELPLDVHAALAARAKANGNTLKQEVLKAVLIGLAK